jgi:hypothetical protein
VPCVYYDTSGRPLNTGRRLVQGLRYPDFLSENAALMTDAPAATPAVT